MNCLVCHRSVSTRAKKCSFCGATTNLNGGKFLFKMNSADEKQLKKYYEQAQEKKLEQNTSAEKEINGSVSSNKTTSLQKNSQAFSNTSQQNLKEPSHSIWGYILLIVTLIMEVIAVCILLNGSEKTVLISLLVASGFVGVSSAVWEGNKLVTLAMIAVPIITFFIGAIVMTP